MCERLTFASIYQSSWMRFLPEQKRDVIYEEIMDSLREYGVHMLNFHKIEKEDRNYLERYFEAEVAPVISPSTIRSSRLIMHR